VHEIEQLAILAAVIPDYKIEVTDELEFAQEGLRSAGRGF